MDKNFNIYEKNDKEKLLGKLDINNSQEDNNYKEMQSPNIMKINQAQFLKNTKRKN